MDTTRHTQETTSIHRDTTRSEQELSKHETTEQEQPAITASGAPHYGRAYAAEMAQFVKLTASSFHAAMVSVTLSTEGVCPSLFTAHSRGRISHLLCAVVRGAACSLLTRTACPQKQQSSSL